MKTKKLKEKMGSPREAPEIDVESSIYRTKAELMEGRYFALGLKVDLRRKLRQYGLTDPQMDAMTLGDMQRALGEFLEDLGDAK